MTALRMTELYMAKIDPKKMEAFIKKSLNQVLAPFCGEKLTETTEDIIRHQLINKLQTLKTARTIDDFDIRGISFSDDGRVDVSCDIQPSILGCELLSPENYVTHDWVDDCVIKRCHTCGLVIQINDGEYLVSIGDNLSCQEYAIREIIE